MTFLENMERRYTTKKYDPEYSLAPDVVDSLKEILHLSPSSINSQPWKFIFIENQELRDSLANVSFYNKPKIEHCKLLVVFNVIDNVAKFEQQMEANLPTGAIEYYHKMLKPLGDAAICSWMERQVYLALGVFLSAAANMNLDATPMEGIEQDKYTQILKLDGYKTLVAVAIGKRAEDDPNQLSIIPKKRLPIQSVIESI